MEAQLNEIENALDNLENQNDTIHSKLKELLESNREIRQEMISLGMINKKEPDSDVSSRTPTAEVSHLQKMHGLSLNNNSASHSEVNSATNNSNPNRSNPK